jgi:aryl-alcohol dehydrogenase-like predicted oxidoreductase
MRLSTDEDRDEVRALATISAAAEAGVTVFDTARAYEDNERLLARALRACRAEGTARILSKGGMSRAGGGWVPDGRAKAIRADCEASLEALDGLPIDVYLLHAPDPRTPWRTSLRALARLADEGLVGRVGVSNVNRMQLDEALAVAPVTVVQVALSVFDDRPLRGGILERCVESGTALIAHAPLGGPRRAGRLARESALVDVAGRYGATPAEIALAWLLGLASNVVAIPGARRPETAKSAARAASLVLDANDHAALARGQPPRGRGAPGRREGEVVLVMGIPGAGKTRVAGELVEGGYLRLNRDERQGSLRELATVLEESLEAGAKRVVLDNTYLTRASRSYVLEAARGHGLRTRCVWLDTPLAQAQVNLVQRLLDRFGGLPAPEELRAVSRREPGLLAPTSQMRALRELEPPSANEGFDRIEHVPFERAPSPRDSSRGVFVAAPALDEDGWERVIGGAFPEAPHLLFDWLPERDASMLARAEALLRPQVSGPIEAAVCPHGAGPPRCWCRPPLPGLSLAFARRHGVAPERSVLVGTSTAHKTLAATLGAVYMQTGPAGRGPSR